MRSTILCIACLAVAGCGQQAVHFGETACDDGMKNAAETDVDCGGGTCDKCDDGKHCLVGTDCKSAVCLNGQCAHLPASCSDGALDGHESDVDCGGDQCAPCDDGKKCATGHDCQSLVCGNGVCQPASCSDMVKNGQETDVDCGGPTCGKCAIGKGCSSTDDCQGGGLCISGRCSPSTCQDGTKNGHETDLDCGGDQCGPCGDGKMCAQPSDCQSGICDNGTCQPSNCNDNLKNGKETDVDCGGGTCPGCDVNQHCFLGGDCKTGICQNGLCRAPSCNDGILNGQETDVDCGGPMCPKCADAKKCMQDSDCVDGVCVNGACVAPGCMDGVKNGQETDVDCGGPMCPKCADNLGCKTGSDCVDGLCVNSQCQPPSCKDGVKNGNETDIDCGGACPPCGPAAGCGGPSDCWDGQCNGGVCGTDQTISVGNGMGAQPFDPNGDGSKLVVTDGMGDITVDRQNALLKIARYIYVSNSGEGTVSKIDPTNMKEVARYCTGPGCNQDPSRASVSLDGDVGVANRANYFYGGVVHPERASAVMIAGDVSRCVDRNGNGKIDTNTQAGAVPQQFVWPPNTTVSPDECVLWWQTLTRDRNGNLVGGAGTLPRSATFDSKPAQDGSLSSNFYVGLYGTGELVQLDARTGAIKQQVLLAGGGAAPYSSVFDRFGNLWIRDANRNQLIKVDTTQPNLPNALFGPAIPCGYAITADRRGYIYGGGSTCVTRIDPTAMAPAWESLALPGACFTRGPALDYNFNLIVPDTCFGGFYVDASKPVGQGMTLKKAVSLPNPGPNSTSGYYLGSAIDGTGIPWVIGTQTDNLQLVNGPAGKIYRIDPNNNYAITPVSTGATPYVYSDLSGSQLALTAPTTGSYRKTFQAFCGSSATWTNLTWSDQTPPATSVTVRYRAAKDPVALQTAPFVTVGTEPQAIPQPVKITLPPMTDPSYLQVEFVISTTDTASKPLLTGVSVAYTCPKQ